MRRVLMPLAFIVVALAALTGCERKDVRPDPPEPVKSGYDAYVDFERAREERTEKQVNDLLAVAASCDSDSCRQAIASNGFVYLAGASGGGQRRIAPPPPPPVKRDGWDIAFGFMDRLVPFGQLHYQDRAAARSLDGQRALFDFLDSAVGNFTPGIDTGGGHYVAGDQHIGDDVGRDQISGQQHIGDSVGRDLISGHVGDAAGRDQISGHVGDTVGGDQVDGDGNYNSGRQDSPDRYGDSCEGEGCQQVNPTDPDPES